MSDGYNEKSDARIDYIKNRIANGFPKLAGSKLEKLLGTDEIRYNNCLFDDNITCKSYIYILCYRDFLLQFCEDEQSRCIVVPETMKLDTVIPSKLNAKGKILVFIKLRQGALQAENIQ